MTRGMDEFFRIYKKVRNCTIAGIVAVVAGIIAFIVNK